MASTGPATAPSELVLSSVTLDHTPTLPITVREVSPGSWAGT